MTSPVHLQLARLQSALRSDPAGKFRARGAGPRTILALGVAAGAGVVGSAFALGAAVDAFAVGRVLESGLFAVAACAGLAADAFLRDRRDALAEARLSEIETKARERAVRALLAASPVGAEGSTRAAAVHAVTGVRRKISERAGVMLDLLSLPLLLCAAIAFAGVAATPLAALGLALALLGLRRPEPRRADKALRALERAVAETLTRRDALEAINAARRQGARAAQLATAAAEALGEDEAAQAPRQALIRALAVVAAIGGVVLASPHAGGAGHGAFAAFILVAARFAWSAALLAEAAPAVRAAWRTLRAPPAEEPVVPSSVPASVRGVLSARGVVVRSGEQTPLRGVSLDLRLGEIVAVCGPAGSGKSVLLEVLAGLRAPESGTVTLDGRPLGAHDPTKLQAAIGYLPQRAALFAGTVAENLRLFAPQASPAQMLEALAQAGLRDAGVLETRVGPNEPLSPGFIAKVLLAGLYAKQPRLMILDDPGAMLDREGDDAFKHRLGELRGAVGVILVTNRPSHMRCCDRIIRLDHGMVRIDGPAKRVLSG